MGKRPVEPEDLLGLVYLSDPQVQPDGGQILFQKKTVGEKNNYQTQICSISLNGHLHEWTRKESGASHGRWSLDGSRIAFFSNRQKPRTQIHVLEVSGGEAWALTDLPEGDFGDFRWSPDGFRIAFAFRERDPLWTEQAAKEREEKGLSVPARIANTPLYRWDGEGFFLDQRHALFVVEISSRKVVKLMDECPWGRYSFDWAPDSKRLAVKRSFQQNLWMDPEDDRIVIVDLAGKVVTLDGQPGGFKSAVRWSPDGEWIAYLGNPDPLDHRGTANTELFLAPAAGGEPRRLTKETDYDLEVGTLSDAGESGGEYLEWSPDSKSLLLSIGWHGENQLARVALSGKLEFLTAGHHVVSPGPTSRDGKTVGCLLATPERPFEVAVWTVKGGLERLTDVNGPLLKELKIASPQELWLEAEDGYPVHAWVLGASDNGKQKPGVIEIHGGPQAQYGWTFFHEFQVLASAGYTVVYSNPRGSKGYGKAHCQAIAGAWGQKDWADIVAVKEWMKRQPGIDPERMGVMGGSYGGYLVNWAVGHTDDFAAAITDRCVSNLMSKALNSDYPYYPGTHWQGSGYGPLEQNADLWRDSPIAYFDRVTTPMLIIHSEGDLRCHIEQGEQVFFALQTRGIPSRMVRYPVSTSHGMSRGGPPDLRIHRLRQILDWWKKWL